MTGLAITIDLCMRGDAAQGLPGDRVQRTRAEHHAAIGKAIARDGQDRDQRGNDPRTRETAKMVPLHSPVSNPLFQERRVI